MVTPDSGRLQTLAATEPSCRPARLALITREPVAWLAWRGSLDAARVVAIVGSRKPSPESLSFAKRLAAACAQAGVVVASGGAIGIDGCAHRATLDAGGVTWAVLATPPERYFPSEHAEFLRALPNRHGTLVWTATAGSPTPRCFHRRNRVLVALADVVVVVQAAARSGSTNAGNAALALRKPLLVVPGSPWDPRFAGSLELLTSGGRVIDDPSRLLSTLAEQPILPNLAAEHRHDARPPLPRLPRLPPRTLPPGVPPQLLGAISQIPVSAEEIAARARLDMATTLTALLTLSLENVVVEDLGGRYRLA
jgi:DNA processing protein